MDQRRFLFEQRQMASIRELRRFSLFEDTAYRRDQWSRYWWEGVAPTGHLLRARYPDVYPYQELDIHLTPDISTHHKIGDSALCLYGPGEWRPHHTAAANILTAFRFLDEYRRRLVR